jgi:hypothetical protein
MSSATSSQTIPGSEAHAACAAQQWQDASVQVGDEQQQRSIVISGLDVQECSITQALLSRCAHRGSVLRSKLILGRLWVQLRTFQQARRAHKEFSRLVRIMGTTVQCDMMHDSEWPKSGIQRGKPGGRRHRGHRNGIGGVRGHGHRGCGSVFVGDGGARAVCEWL